MGLLLNQLILKIAKSTEALRTVEWLLDVLAKVMFMQSCNDTTNREEEVRNQLMIEIARTLHLPLLATNGVCHAIPARREVSDVFTCLRNHVRLEMQDVCWPKFRTLSEVCSSDGAAL
jgi:DNA polymerase III alpha subunit